MRKFYQSTRIFLLILLALCSFPSLPGGTADKSSDGKPKPAPIVIDFEKPFVPVPAGKSTVTGEMDPDFSENVFGSVNVHLSRLTDDVFQGKSALRIEVRRLNSGAAQFELKNIEFPSGYYTKIHLALRAKTTMPCELMILEDKTFKKYFYQGITAWPEWQTFNFIVPPFERKTWPTRFLFRFKEGIVDVDALRVDFIPERELTRDNPVKPGNLLPTSSFPTGLNGQWSLSSHYLDSKAFAAGEKGPTGVTALRLEPGKGKDYPDRTVLLSPGFIANPFRPHTLSLYAKGTMPNQEIRLTFYHDKDKNITRTLTLDPTWKRYSHTVKLPFPVHGFYNMAVSSAKPFLIDGLMVEESDRCNEFRRAGEVEIALRQNTPMGLHFERESLAVKLAVYGKPQPGMIVKGFLRDLYGVAVPVGPWPVKDDLSVTDITLAPGAESAFGTYTLELQAYDRTGKAVSQLAEAVLHRVHTPRMLGRDAPDSPFGVHINATEEQARMAKALGFNWVRTHDAAVECTKWYWLEKKPGVFDYTDADRKVEMFRNHHLMILGLLDTCPTFYSTWISEYKVQSRRWFFLPKPENLDKWSRYCGNTVAHFKGKIDQWEVYNEPYVGYGFFIKKVEITDGNVTVVGGTPEDYVRLLKPAYEAAKTANPSCTVYWMDYPGAWHNAAAKAGAGNYCDGISFHVYNAPAPYVFRDFSSIVEDLKQGLPDNKKNLPLINSETGSGGTGFFNVFRHVPPDNRLADTKLAANAIVRGELANLAVGVRRLFTYTMHYSGWGPGYTVMLPDGNLSPIATALSHTFWQLEGMKFAGKRQISDTYHALLFAGVRETTVVLLSKGVPKEPYLIKSLPVGVTARDLYGNEIKLPYRLTDGVIYFSAVGTDAAALARKIFGR